MFEKDYESPNHRTFVAINSKNKEVLGHAICSVKIDDSNNRYGFCFSRYVHPDYRRKGIATALLREQEVWWEEMSVKYIVAHTHETNNKLKNLMVNSGFSAEGPLEGDLYKYYVLKKNLS